MPILKIKHKELSKRGEGYVGVCIPSHIFSYLTLCVYAKMCPRTQFMIEALEDWMKKQSSEFSEEALVQQIASRAIIIWKRKKRKEPSASINAFKETLIYEFEYKNLPLPLIKRILTHFNNGTR